MHSFSYKQLENIVKTTGATGSITNYKTCFVEKLLKNMSLFGNLRAKLKYLTKSHKKTMVT